MVRIKELTLLLLSLDLIACTNNAKREISNHSDTTEAIEIKKSSPFPQVVKLSQFKQTTFIPNLEKSFDSKQNGIYAASLLMAWDKLRTQIGEPILEI